MAGRRWFLVLQVLAFAGCLGAGTAGRYAYIDWSQSVKKCESGTCTYGTNHQALDAEVKCGSRTELSWDLENWLHGSMAILVHDAAATQQDGRTLSYNGNGNATLVGKAGLWRLDGTTNDANGNLEVRLTCL